MTELEVRSHAAGYFISGSTNLKLKQERLNGPIHVNGNILIFCRLFCRSRKWRVFFDSKRCHNTTKHITINGTPKDHYTSMHGKTTVTGIENDTIN